MSRSITEIYDSLCVAKASMQELHDYIIDPNLQGTILDNSQQLKIDVRSGSKVAIWRLWLWIMAVGSWMVEKLFDQCKADVAELLATTKPHTLTWYANESKKYQYGYPLVRIDDVFTYDNDDPNSRIIKYAAAAEKNGKVLIKVAKEVDDVMTPLTAQEKTLFEEFWAKWRDAGVKVEIVSLAADIIKVTMEIVRDRLVLDANNNLIRDNSINPVNLAIDTFCRNLEFDGILRVSRLQDAIQAAEGVVDVKISQLYHKPAGGNYAAVNMQAESVSGYFTLNVNDSDITMRDYVTTKVLPI
ncbi:MAG TPA: hypothetical protein P5531_10520 [Bacteroidales bacterium]|nr:hypothetical protein [Bacteroidales bacterium]HSA43604.1 hypothetical protein [Bacteroidales bacterium]